MLGLTECEDPPHTQSVKQHDTTRHETPNAKRQKSIGKTLFSWCNTYVILLESRDSESANQKNQKGRTGFKSRYTTIHGGKRDL
jgi:hypothetical protein